MQTELRSWNLVNCSEEVPYRVRLCHIMNKRDASSEKLHCSRPVALLIKQQHTSAITAIVRSISLLALLVIGSRQGSVLGRFYYFYFVMRVLLFIQAKCRECRVHCKAVKLQVYIDGYQRI